MTDWARVLRAIHASVEQAEIDLDGARVGVVVANAASAAADELERQQREPTVQPASDALHRLLAATEAERDFLRAEREELLDLLMRLAEHSCGYRCGSGGVELRAYQEGIWEHAIKALARAGRVQMMESRDRHAIARILPRPEPTKEDSR